jgi:hypothetical protein
VPQVNYDISMPQIDLFINPYFVILLICIITILMYGKEGFTNPLSIFFLFISLYIPIKYYLIVLTDSNFASSASSKFGIEYQLLSILNGGNLLLAFLASSLLFNSIYKYCTFQKRVFSIEITVKTIFPTILISLLMLILFMISKPNESLLDGLALRNFTQTKGMSYLSITFETLSLITIYQYIQSRKYIKLSFLLIYLTIFHFVNGKTSPIITMILFILFYLYSVRKIVPNKSLFFSFILLFFFSLLHGFIRVKGDLINALYFILDSGIDFNLFINQFVERISQLEEFCLLTQLVVDNNIEINYLSPLNVILQFIPRALWDSKPLFFNSNIMSLIYPEIYNAGVNFAFLGIGEFIYTFGITIGIFLAASLMGYLLNICFFYLKYTENNANVFLFFYFVPYFYLTAGFNDGWLNTAVLPTILLNIVIFKIIGKFNFINVKN